MNTSLTLTHQATPLSSSMACYRALGCAVIKQAIRDHLNGDEDALLWLTGEDPAQDHWFSLAGLGPFTPDQLAHITKRNFMEAMAKLTRQVKEV